MKVEISKLDADFEVICSDGKVLVHKFLLVNLSDYFKACINSTMHAGAWNSIPHTAAVFGFVMDFAFYKNNAISSYKQQLNIKFINDVFGCVDYLHTSREFLVSVVGKLLKKNKYNEDNKDEITVDMFVRYNELLKYLQYVDLNARSIVQLLNVYDNTKHGDYVTNTVTNANIYDVFRMYPDIIYRVCLGYSMCYTDILNNYTYDEYCTLYEKIMYALQHADDCSMVDILKIAPKMCNIKPKGLTDEQKTDVEKRSKTLSHIHS